MARDLRNAGLRVCPTAVSPYQILEYALRAFPHQEDAVDDLLSEMHELGEKIRPPPPYPTGEEMLGRNLNLVLLLWDGFDLCRARRKKDAAFFHSLRSLPPLSHWNHKAAWKFIKTRNGTPGLSYETYRKGVSRLGLRQLKPILVQKMRIEETRVWPFAITYTPLGMQWLRENHSLGGVTRNGQKVSHDNLMKLRVNSTGETPGTYLACSRNGCTRST
jgi:hypothetical protein